MKNTKLIFTSKEIPPIWTEFMNDTLSICSLLNSSVHDEEDLKKIHKIAKNIEKTIIKK